MPGCSPCRRRPTPAHRSTDCSDLGGVASEEDVDPDADEGSDATPWPGRRRDRRRRPGRATGRRARRAPDQVFVHAAARRRDAAAASIARRRHGRRDAALAVGGAIARQSVGERLSARTERRLCPVADPGRTSSRAAVADLHERLTIVDLHADSLLWGRDLLRRADRGHVDVPRLVEGNVALQVFAMATKVPRHLNYRGERRPRRTM